MKHIETMIRKIDKMPRLVVNYTFWHDHETGENGIDVVREIGADSNENTWVLAGTVYNKSGQFIHIDEMTKTPANQMIVGLRLETKIADRTMSVDLGTREVLGHRPILEKDIGEMALGEKYTVTKINRRKFRVIGRKTVVR